MSALMKMAVNWNFAIDYKALLLFDDYINTKMH